jgi:uncharacterized membrane protein YqjE
LEAEILIEIDFHLAAILEIQDGRHNLLHMLFLNGIVVFFDPENVSLDTRIEAASGLEAEILREIDFHLAAILEIQNDRHNVLHLLFLNGIAVFLVPEYVSLDTRIEAASDLEAELLKEIGFTWSPFWKSKMAAIMHLNCCF